MKQGAATTLPVPMPVQLPTVVNALKVLLKKEMNVQKAVDEYLTTWDDDELPSQTVIAARNRIPISTLTAHIRSQPSKLASAGLQQKILPNEEHLMVIWKPKPWSAQDESDR